MFRTLAFVLLVFVSRGVLADGPAPPGSAPPPGAKPGSPGSKPSPDGGKDGKPPSATDGKSSSPADGKPAESAEPKVVRRGQDADKPADPEELKATVGGDGRVAFHFRNQPWVELVQWLAQISEQPLDWQELPGDRVNLSSPGRYTVAETRDLFNRHLLSRGYSLLELDGGLTVVKTENVNPAMVRRVEPEELQSLPRHTFVRTLLDVGWLSAEKLAEELKPMISSNGRLTALTTTNRIEAMDAAVNLRQIAELLAQERNSASRDALAPEFKLRHIPAEEAKEMLEQFLGVEEKKAAPMTPQQMQMMQRMQQQNQGKPTPPEPKMEVSIVANVRQNSVLIRAPVDRIAIASEFIKRIDVPSDAMMSLSDIQSRVQVFRLASLDPQKLVEIVSEMNVLEPSTRIRVDADNNALIVSGSAADRFIIGSLIERLDGSGRKFEVLQLRRLDAAEVAESISFLMGQKDEEEDNSSSRRSYYYGFNSGGDEDENKEADEFRVSANARYRQVLLWANDREMAEVRSLLIKLGELPPPGGNQHTFRVIDAAATPETYEYLQQLQQQWQRISNSPLQLPEQDAFHDPTLDASKRSDSAEDASQSNQSGQDATDAKPLPVVEDDLDLSSSRGSELDYQLTAMQIPPAEEPGDRSTTPASQANSQTSEDSLPQDQADESVDTMQEFERRFGGRSSPTASDTETTSDAESSGDGSTAGIRITVDRQGNLVISSDDTEALDRLEELMLQIKPPQRPYRVFRIKHAIASSLQIDLEDYFSDLEEETDSEADSFYRYYWGSGDDGDEEEPAGLGRGNKLKFVWNDDTNTIVVSGATDEQLRTIEELIRLWDVPTPVDAKQMRFTKLVPIRYGKADKIAETLKDAYRDLLSSNDKAFKSKQNEQRNANGRKQTENSAEEQGGGMTDASSGREGGGSDFTFKGKLSMGVDEIGNTLLVSAEGESLLDLVVEMVEQLDRAAMPREDVQIMTLSGGLSGDSLREALRSFGAERSQRPSAGEPSNSTPPTSPKPVAAGE